MKNNCQSESDPNRLRMREKNIYVIQQEQKRHTKAMNKILLHEKFLFHTIRFVQ